MTTYFTVMEREFNGVPSYEGINRRQVPATPPAFTEAERNWMRGNGTVIVHSTYSLQPSSFQQAGVLADVNADRVDLADGDVVVCINTEDRYSILSGNTTIRRYRSIDEWRRSPDYPAELH